ncbi:MAG: SDR family NAD(P)-dependent oxidoreductase, partial [Anaerolineales bacterium]|nr:SDR family NAD(P)-dependent oxidoreductase [Anaerolineales bacterium]
EAAPPPPPPPSPQTDQLLPLSAHTETALATQALNLAEHLRQNPGLSLAAVAATLQTGRYPFAHRRALACKDVPDAIARLADLSSGATGMAAENAPPVVFMFPGQGSQFAGMGQTLYEEYSVFRQQIDTCAHHLAPLLELDLRDLLYPAPDQIEPASARLNQTQFTQPALFATAYALAALWRAWGIHPHAMLGHSIGEYVAACLAGVFTLEEGLRLVAARGRLMQSLPRGGMLSVSLSPEQVNPWLPPELNVAVINERERCVVAGPLPPLHVLADQLSTAGITSRLLQTSHAFHSPMMDPILADFAAVARAMALQPPQLPYISNVSGTWIRNDQAMDPDYWVQQLRQPVQFATGLAQVSRDPAVLLLEVGPGQALTQLARRQVTQPVVPAMRHPRAAQSDAAALLSAAAQLWVRGAPIAWEQLHPQPRRRVPLPPYPFERQRYWLETTPPAVAAPKPAAQGVSDLFYLPSWKRTLPPASRPLPTGQWLLFATNENDPVVASLRAALRAQGQTPIMVFAGAAFQALGDDTFCIDPSVPQQYAQLLAQLPYPPDRIIHAWSLAAEMEPLTASFYSLVYLAQALGGLAHVSPRHIDVLSRQMQSIAGETENRPGQAVLLGPCRVISQEYPSVTCRAIDLDAREWGLLPRELAVAEPGVVAFRGQARWVPTYESVTLPASAMPASLLKPDGIYLITGGLGGVGLQVAAYLAQTGRARIVLLTRSEFPPPETWPEIAPDHPRATAARQLHALRAQGAELLVVQADVTDLSQVERAISLTRAHFGGLDGVFHAAGISGGNLIQQTTPETAAPILAPKVIGTLNLARALETFPIDFLCLFSSLVAITGGPGRTAYTAANAFLDAFAASYRNRGEMFVFSVNWDTWRGVGMAAPAHTRPSPPIHPLLQEKVETNDARAVYRAWLHPDRYWVLAEHRIMSHPSLAGTVYLEMVRAAFAEHTAHTQMQFHDVYFLTPLVMAATEEREIRVVLEKENAGTNQYQFTVQSQEGQAWQTHAQGSVSPLAPTATPRHDIPALLAHCPREIPVRAEDLRREQIELGPRWRGLQSLRVGEGEAVAAITLDAAFAEDLRAYLLHPALLDVAASFAGQYVAQGSYLPLSYRRLALKAPLPAHLFSHARFSSPPETSAETITVDVTLLDASGQELVEIEGFSLKRADPAQWQVLARQLPQMENVYAGISPATAIEALHRILAHQPASRLLVSAYAPDELIRRIETQAAPPLPIPPRATHDRGRVKTPYAPPRSEPERILSQIWQELLGIAPIGIQDNFFELGGDSVLAIQIISHARQHGLRFSPNQLFTHQTIAELTQAAYTDTATPSGPPPDTENASPDHDYPLTPIQSWFFSQSFPQPHHWNQSLQLTLRRSLDTATLSAALQAVLAHHDALRLRFQRAENGWRQSFAPIPAAPPLVVVDLSPYPPADQGQQIAAQTAAWQTRLDLARGPLFQAIYFRRAPAAPDQLLLIAHHLVVDAFSWSILLADLQTAYAQIAQGDSATLPAKTASFQTWAEQLRALAAQPEMGAEWAYWREATSLASARLPLDGGATAGDLSDPAANTVEMAQSVTVALDQAETSALLRDAPRAYHTGVADILLTALAQTMTIWTGAAAVLVALEENGRDAGTLPPDYSRTVGWFTTLYPVALPGDITEPGAAIRTIKEQLRAVPRQGVGYGLLRYVRPTYDVASQAEKLPQPQMSFLYLGQIEEIATGELYAGIQSPPNERAPHSPRPYLLDIIAHVTEQRLRVTWTYNPHFHQPNTIDNLAQTYRQRLQTLITHCQTQEIGQFTPSDFPEAGLDQEALDELVALFTQEST